MTWSFVNGQDSYPNITGSSPQSRTITAGTTGNIFICTIVVAAGSPTPTGLSGGGVGTWNNVVNALTGNSTTPSSMSCWWGVLDGSANPTTLSVSFSGSLSGTNLSVSVYQFHSSTGSLVGSPPTLDISGTFNQTVSSATVSWPSLATAGGGELYFGYAQTLVGTITTGTASGITYLAPGDAICHDVNTSGSPIAPTRAISPNDTPFGYGLLLVEPGGAAPPIPPYAPRYPSVKRRKVGPNALRHYQSPDLGAPSTLATQSDSDVVAGVDTANTASTEPGADTGAGADAAQTTVVQSDASGGSDTANATSTEPGSDVGAGVESQTMVFLVSDGVAGVDTGGMLVTQVGSDVGSGADSAQMTAVQSDTGSGADSATATAIEPAADTEAGFDSAQTTVVQSDAGSGIDSAQTTAVQSDAGSGADSASMSEVESVSDVGSGADVASVTGAGPGSDVGSAVDSAQIIVKNNNVASPRRIVIAAELRMGMVAPESRRTVQGADTRLDMVAAESRTVAVTMLSRVYTMSGVDGGS